MFGIIEELIVGNFTYTFSRNAVLGFTIEVEEEGKLPKTYAFGNNRLGAESTFEQYHKVTIQHETSDLKQDVKYAMDVENIRTSRKTGKTYRKWEFCCWSRLPNLESVKHQTKGNYVIVESSDGRRERFDLSTGVKSNQI